MNTERPIHRLTIAVLGQWIDHLSAENRRMIAVELDRLASRETVEVLSVLA